MMIAILHSDLAQRIRNILTDLVLAASQALWKTTQGVERLGFR